MVRKVRLMLEYHCYPVWLYDENGDDYHAYMEDWKSAVDELTAKLHGKYSIVDDINKAF
jgi:hypothetical protein